MQGAAFSKVVVRMVDSASGYAVAFKWWYEWFNVVPKMP